MRAFKSESLESDIEAYLRDEVKKIGGKAYKWVSPGNPGVPDRIVVHKGRVYFVETKSPSGSLGAKQKLVWEELHSMGAEYRVITCKEDVRGFIKGCMESGTR